MDTESDKPTAKNPVGELSHNPILIHLHEFVVQQ